MSKGTSKTPVIAVNIRAEAGDLFHYKIYNTFFCTLGIYRLLLSAACIAAAIIFMGRASPVLSPLLFFLGLLNPVVTPLWYLLQSHSKAPKNNSTIFTFCGPELTLNEGGKRVQLRWDALSSVAWTKRSLLLYIAPNRAFILPRRQLGKNEEALYLLVKENSGLCPTKFTKSI